MTELLSTLKKVFGHESFLPGQEALVTGIIEGRDVLGIMPTGGGKSVCYQLPALSMPGMAIVISPLISLMRDQVIALGEMGVPAAFINSTLSAEEYRDTVQGMMNGAYKLVYVAPERLEGDAFPLLCRNVDISLVAVDEAHCISQWGQDFRPSYLKIENFLEKLPYRPPVAAFTATATVRVRNDIEHMLNLRDPVRVVTGFDRPNLYFDVWRGSGRDGALMDLIQQRLDRSGIVYCSTRKNVEMVHELLTSHGVSAARYHAGLPDWERHQSQEDFLYDRKTVMVATNAFGMGIDKSNVSYVIHYNMPMSLEAYYQEAGRAGRDGAPADCILLYSPADISTAQFLIDNSHSNDNLSPEERNAVILEDYKRLAIMSDYCNTTRCLRGMILDYFGQEHAPRCGNCGNCLANISNQDITVEAQKILSCVRRIRDKLGYNLGAALTGQVLCGSRSQRVLDLGLDSLSTYGIMKGVPSRKCRDMMMFLEREGYIYKTPSTGALSLTAAAGDVLFRGKKVNMPVREMSQNPVQVKERRDVALPDSASSDLYDVLRALRLRLAQDEKVPAYVIFSNATLADMAEKRPRTKSDFMKVSGVGRVKADRYGAAFLREIRRFETR